MGKGGVADRAAFRGRASQRHLLDYWRVGRKMFV
jgi:hypothetical protein